MRKTLILVGMVLISFLLVACGEDVAKVTPPTFNSITIDGTAPVVDGELVTYYKGKNEIILVEVNITNPDGLLITSIIIDGYNYFASRFLDTTTTTAVYFEMSAGTTLGEKVLSLDEIVYKNGVVSESVLVSSNNEFVKYVFKNIPTVDRESYSVTEDTIVVNFDILDIDGVIATDTLIAELYSGETLVNSIVFNIGQTEVEFSSLLSNKNYDIKVKANFNLDDSLGYKTEVVLYSGPFSTLDNSIPTAKIENLVITSNSIIFDVVYNDNDSVTNPGGITVGVFRDDIMVGFVDLGGSTNGVYMGGLLNNNEYTIKVLSDYDLLDGHSTITDAVLATHTFSTLPRLVPEPSITNLNIEENRIMFGLSIDDPDGLIDKDTLVAKLYVEGELKETVAVNEYSADFQIYNLFANDIFVIVIEASYNLNDGVGVQENQIIYSQEYTTYENDVPLVYVSDLVVTQGYVSLDIEVIDEDFTLKGALTAKLYEIYFVGDVEFEVEVGAIQFDAEETEVVFAYLTSYLKGYRVDILANYDLRDGSVPKANENLFRSVLLSSERKAPAVEFNDVVFGVDQIEVNINVMDSDGTIVTDSVIVYLYLGDTLVDFRVLDIGPNAIIFDTLYSNNEYRMYVEVDYVYDLIDEDVLLENQELVTSAVYTLEKEIPIATISEVFGFIDYIEFKVVIVDDFDTIDDVTLFAVLFLDDIDTGFSQVVTVGNNFGVTFNGLLSDKQYEIRIITNYDLNDGTGELLEVELMDYFVYSKSKSEPIYQNFNISATQDEISFDVEVIDSDGVIITNPVAKLYIGGTDTGQEIDLVIGVNSSITFSSVLSSERYNIRIMADYDYNDGTPVSLDMSIAIEYINTLPNAMITALITDVVIGKDSITFDVDVTDENTISTGNLEAVLYDELGVQVGLAEVVLVGENLNVEFTGLKSETNYTVKIESDYNLNEGDGEVLGGVLNSEGAITLALSGPSATITVDQAEVLNSRIEFDATVTDNDSTVTTNLQAVLYKDGVATGDTVALVVGDNLDKFFDDLEFGAEYVIQVETDYNLNNGSADVDAELLEDETVSTISIILLSDIVEDKKLINYILEVDDQFSILSGFNVEVRLFDENDLQVGGVYYITTLANLDLLNLWSDYDYYIEVTATYDVGAGDVTDTVFTHLFNTLPVEIPNIQVVDLDVSNATDIVFEVSGIADPDGIISGFVDDNSTPGTLEAVLYIDGVAEGTTIPLPTDGTYTFAGYDGTDGSDYAIVIQATVDINDSNGATVGFEFVVKSWIYADKN